MMFSTPKIPGMLMTTLYKVTKGEGYHDQNNGGEWVDGKETLVPFKGAVLPLSSKTADQNLQYGEGGTYTRIDWKLYANEELQRGQEVTYNNERYTVERSIDYGYVSGFRQYGIKKVGVASD